MKPRMRINHLILGTADVEASVGFYQNFLQFRWVCNFIDTGTGGEGTILRFDGTEGKTLEFLIVPFEANRLPNPQHFAVEVSPAEFETLLSRAREQKLRLRGSPSLSATGSSPGEVEVEGMKYRNFYVLDPAGINVEIMVQVKK